MHFYIEITHNISTFTVVDKETNDKANEVYIGCTTTLHGVLGFITPAKGIEVKT